MSDYRLSDLLDLTILQKMADAHYRAANMPIGIIDAIDGSILVGSGWQDICVKFHRVNPALLKRCQASDEYVKGHLVEGEACHYKCQNGLWDIGIPIVVVGRHLATMFLGQFFYEDETPDREFFVQLAHEYGFDVDDYLAALDRVPVFSREKVDYILEYDKALVSFIADLTEHSLSKIKADQIIDENELRFHAIFDQTYEYLGLLSVEGKMLAANRTALRFAGVEEVDVIGKPFWETRWWAHSPELQEKVRIAVKKAAKGEFIRFEATHRSARGNLHYVDFSLKPVVDEAGKVVLLIPEGRNITERRRAEEALRISEVGHRTILDSVNDAIFIHTTDGKVIDVNDKMLDMYKVTREEAISMTIVNDFSAPDNPLETVGELWGSAIRGEKRIFEWKARRPHDNSFFPAEVFLRKIALNNADAILATVRDITDRKRIEEELCKARDELELRVKERTKELAQFAAAVENAIDGIVLSEGYKIFYANRAFERITGYALEELIEKDLMILRNPAKPVSFYDDIRESVSKRRIWTGVCPAKKKDGTTIYLETHVSLIKDTGSLVLICNDITDNLRLEEELRQARKMEAIGTLAGGIAHDFNNILAAVLGFSEIALEDTEQPHVERSLKQVIGAALRGRDLVKQILTFSRKATREKKIVDLAPVIRETFNMLRSTLPSTINMELAMSAENYTARADISGIPQVVMNICTNAAHAMPNGGSLSLSVTGAKFTSRRILPDQDLKLGQYLVLSFTDTGTGMDEAVSSRVFEPFFTTKGAGQGTGMGMAVVYGIVKDHGGAITVESSPGEGSTFVVYLPVIHDKAKEEAPTVEPAATGGHERILFVDDEQSITTIAQQMLTRLGYDVVVVDEPTKALELFKTDPHAFDLVITDQTMPNFTGLALAKKLLALRPDLPIILSTGYSEAVSPERLQKAGIRQLLMKPLQRRDWAETIRRVLDAPGSENRNTSP